MVREGKTSEVITMKTIAALFIVMIAIAFVATACSDENTTGDARRRAVGPTIPINQTNQTNGTLTPPTPKNTTVNSTNWTGRR
jgi:hypothetical protein